MKLQTYLNAYRRRVEQFRLAILSLTGNLRESLVPKDSIDIYDEVEVGLKRVNALEKYILKRAEPETVQELERRIMQLSGQIRRIQAACSHTMKRMEGDSMICNNCNKRLGWFCNISPSTVCQYDYKNNGELCIHCGEPEERK